MIFVKDGKYFLAVNFVKDLKLTESNKE